jgi:hypothetical protein
MESQKWKMEMEKLVECWQAMGQSERALSRLWASMMFQIIFCFMLRRPAVAARMDEQLF